MSYNDIVNLSFVCKVVDLVMPVLFLLQLGQTGLGYRTGDYAGEDEESLSEDPEQRLALQLNALDYG